MAFLLDSLCTSCGKTREELWPVTGAAGITTGKVMELAEPLYYRTLQFVLPLLSPLMKPWEVKSAEGEMARWAAAPKASTRDGGMTADHAEALASLSLDQLVDIATRILCASGQTFVLGPEVTLCDFVLIPSFHMLLLAGYPLSDAVLGTIMHNRRDVCCAAVSTRVYCAAVRRLPGDVCHRGPVPD